MLNGNSISMNPPCVGGYRIGDQPAGSITFGLTQRPSAWHRFWVRIILGWKWVEFP